MNKEKIEITIMQEIFKREIESVEKIFNDKINLQNNLKNHNDEINQALKAFFDLATEILQKIIDDNLKSYFEVPHFYKMNLENFDFTFNHNSQILKASQRLLKFIN